MKPLFKYMGGKTWLKTKLREVVEHQLSQYAFSSYSEPFAGALGSFLSVHDLLLKYSVKDIYLSDINPHLISVYQYIQDSPESLIFQYIQIEKIFYDLVKDIQANDKNELKSAQEYFNLIKSQYNQNKNQAISIEQAARFIFLQKHSFNGIYRENQQGQYNTPFGWNTHHMMFNIKENIVELNRLFTQFNIFFQTIEYESIVLKKDCLYYLDPPYINQKNVENKYNKNGFDLKKQKDLLTKFQEMSFIYSNHEHPLIMDELAKNKEIKIKFISRKNIVSAQNESRSQDKVEILAYKI